MQLTKAQEIKHSRKIERELQIDLGMNYNRTSYFINQKPIQERNLNIVITIKTKTDGNNKTTTQ
jgi:hypothetical protein